MKALAYGELTLKVLTDAALRVAQRTGVEGLTLRALAAELGLSHTALYHHVRGKQELLDLLTERVLSDVVLPTDGPWTERLRIFAHSARHSMLRVPGIAMALQTRPLSGAAVHVDALMKELVREAGVPAAQRESAQMLLMTFVMGSVSQEQALEGLSHRLRTSGQQRFDDGLDIIIRGLPTC